MSYDLDAVLPKADAVMMLRVQRERMNAAFFPSAREYTRRYGLDARRMATLPDHAIVMHPGPMNRGMEITADVADSAALGRSSSRSPTASPSGWPCCTCCSAAPSRPIATDSRPTGRGDAR